MKLELEDFRAASGKLFKLKKHPTEIKPLFKSEEQYDALIQEQIETISNLQTLLYADNRYALLLIFQAMDAGGKDSAIKHVMSGVNPQGCQVYSFKQPSAEELDHDFLWRATLRLPERGRIGIFNRSYYEEVLIVRVHPDLIKAEGLPKEDVHDGLWKGRFQSINDFEAHLARNGTRVVKFFLNISRQQQRKRFLKRLEDPAKNWKFSAQDLEERKHWKDYMHAYEACIRATSTPIAPWYVVPADDKKNARLIVAAAIVAALKELKMSYPKGCNRNELAEVRKQLEKE